jgi:RNA polymerase sigma-70 factor (ECF subfamily)
MISATDLYDDFTLFSSISKGDEQAFGILFHKYRLKIYTFILRSVKSESLAEELTHDVLLSIWVQQEKLTSIENPQGYLFSIVYHKIYTCLQQQAREKKKRQQLPTDEVSYITEEMLDANESKRLLHEAVQQLPPQRKKIYQLRHEEGMSYEHIASDLNISPNTVKNQLVEAVKSIRLYIQKACFFLLFFHYWF